MHAASPFCSPRRSSGVSTAGGILIISGEGALPALSFVSAMLGAHPQEDLLSVARRLLDPVQSTQFSHFAGMLDREAYGAAFAAHLFRQKGDWSRVLSCR